MKKVLVVMGSDSDLMVMEKCVDRLKSFDIPVEVRICSAHRTPAVAEELAKNAAAEGFGVIIAAAGKLIGEKGYYGTSLKDIADAIGMSQPGLLHYIGNKERLLSLLVTDNYDQEGTPADFAKSGLPGSDPEGMLFPAYLRFLVRYNESRRSLLQLYMVLETESFSEGHPLHDYFENRPKYVWEHYSQYTLKLPPEIGGWENMRAIVRKSLEAMDGIQLRWTRKPPVDFYDEWLAFEKMIFPSPVWDSYR